MSQAYNKGYSYILFLFVCPISELAGALWFQADIFYKWCFEPQQQSGELQDKTYKQQVCCLMFLPAATSNRRKKNSFQCQNISIQNLLFLP